MSELQSYRGDDYFPRDARRASRAISRHQAGAQVRTSQIDADTDVAIAKMDAGTAATGVASAAVLKVARLHEQLELMAPSASTRLNYLGESHMMFMGESVTDLHRDLRRR